MKGRKCLKMRCRDGLPPIAHWQHQNVNLQMREFWDQCGCPHERWRGRIPLSGWHGPCRPMDRFCYALAQYCYAFRLAGCVRGPDGHPSASIGARRLGGGRPSARACSSAVFSSWHVLHRPVRLSRSSLPPSDSGVMWSHMMLGCVLHRLQIGSSASTPALILAQARPRVRFGEVPAQAIRQSRYACGPAPLRELQPR